PPSQSDYWQATKALGHGDFQMIVLAPCSVQEIVDMTVLAFDKAEEYRVPVMILADGLLGQMMEPVTFPEDKHAEKKFDWATDGHENKREHNVINTLFLQPDVLEKSVDERFKRYEKIIENEQRSELFDFDENTEIAVVAYGACARVVKSAIRMAKEKGINAGLIRPQTLWPFPNNEMKKNAGKGSNVKHILTVEMSKGQMVEDVRAAVEYDTPVSFYGRHGGVIPTPAEVLEEIQKIASALNGGEE
ncbi:MAG: 3-methyl-2-oxobutanoate dehydrogenase subunit beta, partial [Ruminococcus sp.]|nr:3-methyl-2-oxobutanoate dehydrogenase subunit beta [Ruminococcus sp.]